MAYTKTTWQNDQAPAINATNLNKIEDGIFNNDAKTTEVLETIGIDTDTWESLSSYELGNVVIYNDKLYKNITGNYTTTNPAEDTTNWQEQLLIANWPLENTARVNSNLLPIADDYTETSAKIYSCDYVNNLHTYSTDEIRVGTLMGKPVYRKVYYNSNYSQSASQTQDISFALPNLDTIVSVYGSAKMSGTIYTLPNSMWANVSGMQYSWNINAFTSTGFKINTGSGSPVSNAIIYLVIEYTKTTD